jgi:hypothetical protein
MHECSDETISRHIRRVGIPANLLLAIKSSK